MADEMDSKADRRGKLRLIAISACVGDYPTAMRSVAARRGPGNLTNELLTEALQEAARNRIRRSFFCKSLFLGVAWDVLISLLVNEERGFEGTLAELSRDIEVTEDTAARYVLALEQEGLLQRDDDPDAGIPSTLTLTENGRLQLISGLENMVRAKQPTRWSMV